MNMATTTYNSTEDMINKLQSLKGKTILKFYKSISNYYDNMNISMDEVSFAINAQGISKIYHKLLLLMKFLQSKPQIKIMNISYYRLYFTIINNTDEKEIVNAQYENDYNNFNDIVPNHIISIKPRETTLR